MAGRTTASPYFVVVHVPLAALVDESGETTGLAGELERDGLISCETVRHIACDATIAIGVDDDVGHTMYEGRARREPTDAQRREVMRRDRHCRFPGCTNATFTNIHHVVPWKPGGRTDLENLALLCLHHHHLVHSGGWTMSGNANEELTFVGPTGRVMTSRPSPLWTTVTAGSESGYAAARRLAAPAAQLRRHLLAVRLARRGLMTSPVKKPISLSSPPTKRAHSSGCAADHLVEHGAQGVGPEGLEAHLLGQRGRVSPAALEQRAPAPPWTGSPRAGHPTPWPAGRRTMLASSRSAGLALGRNLVGGAGQGQRRRARPRRPPPSPGRPGPGRRRRGSGPSRRRSAHPRARTPAAARRSAGIGPRPARTRSCHAASGASGTRSGSGK